MSTHIFKPHSHQLNSHQNNLRVYTALQVRGKIFIHDFEVNCPFKWVQQQQQQVLSLQHALVLLLFANP